MALRDRTVFDPRFAFAARPTMLTTMMCKGELRRNVADPGGVPSWDPHAADVEDRQPELPLDLIPIYRGPARVQPQQGWRARSVNQRDELITVQTTRIQLDLSENELGDFPEIMVGDFFQVIEVFTLDGVPVDPQLTEIQFVVQNFTPTSNSWVRTLFCDTVMP